LALKAMFVFRSDEPASTWNFIVSGPLSTLPAVIVSYFWPKIGGTWLIAGSVLSFLFAIASMQTDWNLHDIVCYLLFTVVRCWYWVLARFFVARVRMSEAAASLISSLQCNT
jgi:hypothetical protein